MSGILIRNAYMPENCWDCSGRIAGDIQTFNEAVSMVGGKCPYLERIVNPKEFNMHSGRHPDCPLSEVKIPHGRLIDKDKLRRELFLNFNGERIPFYDCDNFPTTLTYRDLHSILAEQPTIIEAEE